MDNPRNGKIARLPGEIREQLNLRLQNGEKSPRLEAWLNALPAVQALMASEFDGQPVSQQNISRWRQGGYREWLVQQDAIEALRRVNGDTEALREHAGDLTDNIALWLASRYLVAGQRFDDATGELDWKHLREFCHDLVALRRGDHNTVRLEIDAKRQTVQELCAGNRWKRGVINGLESLRIYIEKHPKAREAFDALVGQVTTPFDNMDDADSKPDSEQE